MKPPGKKKLEYEDIQPRKLIKVSKLSRDDLWIFSVSYVDYDNTANAEYKVIGHILPEEIFVVLHSTPHQKILSIKVLYKNIVGWVDIDDQWLEFLDLLK